MGRKNLLSGLLVPQSDEPTSDKPQLRPIEPIGSALPGARGVIGAVSRSIEQLRSHSVVELAPELVAERPSRRNSRNRFASTGSKCRSWCALIRPRRDAIRSFMVIAA
jgi:hypothetical protein